LGEHLAQTSYGALHLPVPEVLAQELRTLLRNAEPGDSRVGASSLLRKMPHLAGLPSVVGAGPDARQQYRQLRRLVERAAELMLPIEDIPQEPPAPRDLQRRYETIKVLISSADSIGGLAWGARQRQAAQIYHENPDTFRKRTTDVLLVGLARKIGDAAVKESNATSIVPVSSGVGVFEDQAKIEADLVSYIRGRNPARARLLEYSCATIMPILQALRDTGCETRILMCHPDAATSEWQRQRILASLHYIRDVVYAGAGAMQIRFYSTSPSLRGREVGERIMVGWYTSRDNPKLDVDDQQQPTVWGHDNPIIASDGDSAEGLILQEWFAAEFEKLWIHRRTRDDGDLFPGNS